MDVSKYTLVILVMCHDGSLLKTDLARNCKKIKEITANVTKIENRKLFLDIFNESSEFLTSAQFDCIELNFISETPNGHVCVLHIKPIKLLHEDLAMYLHIESTVDLTLTSTSGQQWDASEKCSTNNALTIGFVKMKKVDFVYKPNMLDNLILYIYDIQNLNREIYMIRSLCDSEYPLYNGRIMIYDKPPKLSDPDNEILMTDICPIKLINKLEENSFCLLYTILSRGDPDTKWTVYFIPVTVDPNSASKDAVYTFSSNSESYGQWCDNTVRDSISLLLITSQTKYSDSAPQLFQIELSTSKEPPTTTTTTTLTSSRNASENIKDTPRLQASTQGLQLSTDFSHRPSGFLGDGLAKFMFFTFMIGLMLAVTVSVYYYLTRIRVQKINEVEEAGKSATGGTSNISKAKSNVSKAKSEDAGKSVSGVASNVS